MWPSNYELVLKPPAIPALPATLLPNAPGDRTEWTVNGAATLWEACRTNDGDTSFGSCCWPSDNLVALFHLDALPAGVGTIANVLVSVVRRRTNNSLAITNVRIKTNGVEYSSGNQFSSSTSYVTATASWSTNPNTGLAWTVAEVNALQAGALMGSNFWCTYCTHVSVLVT